MVFRHSAGAVSSQHAALLLSHQYNAAVPWAILQPDRTGRQEDYQHEDSQCRHPLFAMVQQAIPGIAHRLLTATGINCWMFDNSSIGILGLSRTRKSGQRGVATSEYRYRYIRRFIVTLLVVADALRVILQSSRGTLVSSS